MQPNGLSSQTLPLDCLIVGQIVAVNPAHTVRGPERVVKCGKAPALAEDGTSWGRVSDYHAAKNPQAACNTSVSAQVREAPMPLEISCAGGPSNKCRDGRLRAIDQIGKSIVSSVA
jgi:hypothetical protein